VHEGKKALEDGDFDKIAELFEKNQELLREITVSSDEIEDIITTGKANGATSGKLTGTGRGGYVILLTPGDDIQNKVADAIKAKGYPVMKTSIGS